MFGFKSLLIGMAVAVAVAVWVVCLLYLFSFLLKPFVSFRGIWFRIGGKKSRFLRRELSWSELLLPKVCFMYVLMLFYLLKHLVSNWQMIFANWRGQKNTVRPSRWGSWWRAVQSNRETKHWAKMTKEKDLILEEKGLTACYCHDPFLLYVIVCYCCMLLNGQHRWKTNDGT